MYKRQNKYPKKKNKGQKNKIDMEELKVKVVEVSQEKEQPQGNDYIRAVSYTHLDVYKRQIFVLPLKLTDEK